MSLVDTIIARTLTLQVALWHARARLEADSDDEALHDLRTALRRLRSLLRPLRGSPGVIGIEEAARSLSRLSTPIRDLEVLGAELQRQGMAEAAATRRASLQRSRALIVASPELERLFARLAEWPQTLRAAERIGGLWHLDRKIGKHLHTRIERLRKALADPLHDRHDLRILAKRVRYTAEAYPLLSPLDQAAQRILKAVQSTLGDWHDHVQLCLKAELETDLQPLHAQWQLAALTAQTAGEAQLLKLAQALET
jgi:CHAD domain-containing protein